jgi:threonine dehydrogenase-like Zn-dependent dehydrogenase
VEVAFECCGTQESIDDATRMLRPGGTLVLIGIPEVDRITYDPHLARRREITIVNVRRQNRCVEQALSILERRRDAARVLLTHRFPPRKAKEAFDLVQQKADGVIKAVLEF